MESRIVIVVPPDKVRVRVEDFLLDRFTRLSKMYLRDVVRAGRCEVNGREENIGYRLRPNDLIEITLDETRETAMVPEDIPLDIVYEDAYLLGVNKPVGMLMHPSHRDNNGTLLNALSFYLNRDSGAVHIRAGLPHRLDKQTSGIVLVAKSVPVHAKLSGQFMKKRVTKRYVALVDGIVAADAGEIEAPIGRFAEEKIWGVMEDGRAATSRFRVIERIAATTLLELEPVTGRTNQLRIHCEHIGHPIVGDVQRGGSEYSRLCLHAHSISFDHPITRERMQLTAPVPPEIGSIT